MSLNEDSHMTLEVLPTLGCLIATRAAEVYKCISIDTCSGEGGAYTCIAVLTCCAL